MVNNINEIMDMLDWKQDLEIQEKGRVLASQVECLKIFFQPKDEKYNKNVWDNCALVIAQKNDTLIQPYMFEMLEWIQDLNWPGAPIIFERLRNFQNLKILGLVIDECIKKAYATDDVMWLHWLGVLLRETKTEQFLTEKSKLILNEKQEVD